MKNFTLKSKFFWLAAALLAAIVFALTKLGTLSSFILIFILACLILIPLIIKKPQIGPALIGFFLTFERVPSLEVGGISIRINFFLIFLTLIVYLVNQLCVRKFKFKFDPIRSATIVLILLMIVSTSQAINLSRALMVIVSMGLMFCLYLVMSMVIETEEDLVLALKGLLWGALVASVFGLYQFLGDMVGLPNSVTFLKQGYDSSTFGFARVQAGAYEPLYFANYIFIPLSVLLFLNLNGRIKKVFNRKLSIVLGLLLLINFVLAISRGAYLAAGVTLVILLIFQAKRFLTFKNLLIALFISFFVATGVYVALIRSEPRALDEFVAHLKIEDRTEGESVVLRLSTSAEAINLFKNHPLLGIGPGNFGPAREDYPSDVPTGGWAIVNNEYLEIAAEGGLIGIVGFLLLLVIIFTRIFHSYRHSKNPFLSDVLVALAFALIAVLAQYFTFSTLYITHVWYLIGLIGAVTNMMNNGKAIKA